MKNFLAIVLMLFSVCLYAQQSGNVNMKVESTEAYYPQGDQALYTYIYNHLVYSEEAKAANAYGEVMLSFYVERDSTITGVKILSNIGYQVGENLAELMGKLKYAPALTNGTPMRSKVLLTVPVRAK